MRWLRNIFRRSRKPKTDPSNARTKTIQLDRQEVFQALADCAALRLNVADYNTFTRWTATLSRNPVSTTVVFEFEEIKPEKHHLRVVK